LGGGGAAPAAGRGEVPVWRAVVVECVLWGGDGGGLGDVVSLGGVGRGGGGRGGGGEGGREGGRRREEEYYAVEEDGVRLNEINQEINGGKWKEKERRRRMNEKHLSLQ